MSEPILKVSNIETYYGPIAAIRGVSFDVSRGGIVTILGANGAGKSTVLKTIFDMGAYTRRDVDGTVHDLAAVFEYFPVLKERAEQRAGSLSGGEQQMLAISRAPMSRPRLMLLDEPSL